MKADKGNQIVIVNKNDYVSHVSQMLNDPAYRVADNDETSSTLKNVKEAVCKSSFLTAFEKRKAIPSSAVSARLYALPKVHKDKTSYRPIVSGIGTATYELASILSKKLDHLSTLNTHSVKDSESFVKKLKDLPFTQKGILVSFDVKALFTNVPVQGALDTLRRRLTEVYSSEDTVDDIMRLVSVCVSNTQFLFNGELYSQSEGLAMGNPLSPLLAEIYLHYFEDSLLISAPKDLQTWLRYVDDVFSFWTGTIRTLGLFLNHLNSLNSNIQFTFEYHNSELPFLDVLVMKTDHGFEFTVYRKPFSVSMPIHRRSAHPWSQKMAAFYYYVKRALVICSNETLLQAEIQHLKLVALDRGFSTEIIDAACFKIKKKLSQDALPTTALSPIQEGTQMKFSSMEFYPTVSTKIAASLKQLKIQAAFTPAMTIKNLFKSTKDTIPVHKKWGIYKLSCECSLSYIGQTRRTLAIRSREHAKHTENEATEKSAIAKHCVETGHKFGFEDPVLLYQPRYYSQLDVAETVFIRSSQNQLVNSDVMPYLHHAWTQFVTQRDVT